MLKYLSILILTSTLIVIYFICSKDIMIVQYYKFLIHYLYSFVLTNFCKILLYFYWNQIQINLNISLMLEEIEQVSRLLNDYSLKYFFYLLQSNQAFLLSIFFQDLINQYSLVNISKIATKKIWISFIIQNVIFFLNKFFQNTWKFLLKFSFLGKKQSKIEWLSS